MFGRIVPIAHKAQPRVWQVCFAKRTRTWWVDRFLPDGFRHVYLIGYVPEFGLWLLFDPLNDATGISILSKEMAGRYLTLAMTEGAVLNFPARTVIPRVRFWHRLDFWCVPAVRHVLGLGCVATTPRGLHDYLVSLGAQPLTEEDNGRVSQSGCSTGIASDAACA